jgi:GntR family transcriptional regulator, transcriptional repressor for pyruvate dehydrogenase complex
VATPIVPALHPVARQSLSDAVFGQLRDQILSGALPPGSVLPAERVLCEELGVNRGAVREALRRLEQARLVSVRHGGSSRVLDFRTSAGMDLLVELLRTGAGGLGAEVVRGIVEMRTALGPDVARLAAQRRAAQVPAALHEIVRRMRGAERDLARLQPLSHAFWTELVAASGNLAYQLAFNTLGEVYASSWDLLRGVLADELGDTDGFEALARAVEEGDAPAAEACARRILRLGEQRLAGILARIDARAASAAQEESP